MSVTLLRRLYNTLLRLRGIKTWINSTPLHHAFIFSWHASSKISNNYTEKKQLRERCWVSLPSSFAKKNWKDNFFLSSGGGRYVVTFE